MAEQSNEFTEEIGKIIKELTEKTTDSVKTIKTATEIIQDQSESVYVTNAKFEGIADAIDEMNELLMALNSSSHEMEVKKNEIVDIMQDLSAIAQESAAGTEEASASVEEQTASMEGIAKASEALARLADELQMSIIKFKY